MHQRYSPELSIIPSIPSMSDYEDEMDVDKPAPRDDITFSDNLKGKRSAANLPVEAEDSLPWYEQSNFI
jgi:hypothetical protein